MFFRIAITLVFGAALTPVIGCFSSSRPAVAVEEVSTIGACNPRPCVRVATQDLVALPVSVPEVARDSIYSKVDEILYASLIDGAGAPSRARLESEVRQQLDEYLSVADPSVPVEWQISRLAKLLAADQHVVSVEVSSEGFLGGAHGFRDVRLLSFDAATGKALGWDDLVDPKSREPLLKVAEAEFRKSRNIPLYESLSGAGFDFPGGDFELASNFAILPTGVRMHYNPYEIAPYVFGPTEVLIPSEVASGVLKSGVPALALLNQGGSADPTGGER